MMNPADDESQIASSFENNLKLSNASNTNNLINEAFSLNKNIGNVQPFTVLPPSSNHFQPIAHSRTPSTDITKQSPSSTSIDSSLHKKTPSESFNNSTISFFDQIKPVAPTNTTNLVSPPNPLASKLSPVNFSPLNASLIKPPTTNVDILASATQPSTQLFAPIPTKSAIPQTTQLTSPTQLSNVAPPVSIPPPPTTMSMPPPPTTASLTGSSNPYSAKGALNKKVYDNNVVSVASIIPPVSGTSPLLTTNDSNLTTTPSLYMQPPTTTNSYIPPTLPMMTQTNQFYMDNSNNHTSGPEIQLINNNDLSSFQVGAHQQTQYDQQQYNNNTNNNNYNNYYTQQETNNGQNNNGSKWNNWFNSKLVNTFVEKAKHSVEQIVTTIDPQMKDYMHPANKPILLVSSISNAKLLHTLRDSFNYAGFSKLTINATDTQNSSQFAPQIVGYACAIQSAKEKLDNTLMQVNNPDCVVISFQDFLAELSTDSWFELAVIMLKDRANNIDLTIFTEAIPVSNDSITQLQQLTPNDYPFKYSGFSYRLPEKNFNFNVNPTVITYDTAENIISQVRISNALKTLAFLFKNRLLNLTGN